jgi:tetratricopeptide (TPR) repeat protein
MLAAVLALGLTTGCEKLLWPVKTDKQVEAAIVAGDWQKVADLAGTWHRRAPRDPVPAQLMWEAARRLGDLEGIAEALKEMDRMCRVERWDSDRVARWGSHFAASHDASAIAWQIASYATSDRDEELRAAERAIRLAPDDWRSWCRSAGAHWHAGDNEGAIHDASRALTIRPNDPETYDTRSVAYRGMRDYDHAFEDINRAIALAPKAYWLYEDRAGIYIRKKDYEKAVADLSQAIGLDPEYIDAYRQRAWLRNIQHEDDLQVKDLDKVVELDPFDADARIGRIEALGRTGHPEDAATDGPAVLGLLRHARTAGDLTSRGDAYRYLGRQRSALRDYDRAIAKAPRWKEAWLGRGISHMLLRNCEEAVVDFTRAVGASSEYADGYLMRGWALAYSGQWSRAADDLDLVIKLDPRQCEAYCGRGLAYENMGRTEDALRDFAESRRLGGKAADEMIHSHEQWIDYEKSRRERGAQAAGK